jgi:alpha-L-fucosidase 2
MQSSAVLPTLEVSLHNKLADDELENITCRLGYVLMQGLTQLGPPEGMRYNSIARVTINSNVKTSCINATSVLVIMPHSGAKSVSIIVGAETNYDAKKGMAEFGYSFEEKIRL